MDEKLSELEKLFFAAVQDKPSAREKMANLLDSLDVSHEEDRIKIDVLSEIVQWSGQQWLESLYNIASEGDSDAWYIIAFCEFYGLVGIRNLRQAVRCLLRCKDHEDANRFGHDHNDTFMSLQGM